MQEPGPGRDDLPGWVGLPLREGLPNRDGLGPRTFQGRLTLGFVAVVAITLGLVGALVINRVGAYFDQQQQDDLTTRSQGVAQYVFLIAEGVSPVRPVITDGGAIQDVVVLE